MTRSAASAPFCRIFSARCRSEADGPSALALRELFGLTAAEARFAVALAEGAAVEEIASRLGISMNTARTHLKAILAKTGTNRQAQLVAVLLRSVATLGTG